MSMNSFAKNFTVLRKKKGITQEQMAELCGVSRPALAKWESGNTTPNIYMVDAISKIYEVTIDELMHGQMEDVIYSGDVADSVNQLSYKIDNMKDELLSAIRKRDFKEDLHKQYCHLQKVNELQEKDEDVPREAYSYWGSEAAEKGNYNEAISYFEEALIHGDIDAADSLLQIYEEIIDIMACEENPSDYWRYKLIQAQKMQQYGKIIEDEIKSGRVF